MIEDPPDHLPTERKFGFTRLKIIGFTFMVLVFGPPHWVFDYCPEHHRFFERADAVPVVFGDWVPAAFCKQIRAGRVIWGGTTTTWVVPIVCPYCHWPLDLTWRKSDYRGHRRVFSTDADTAYDLWRECTTKPALRH